MNVYLVIAFIVAMVFVAGCGLMVFDRYLEKKRDERIVDLICDGVIPAAEKALNGYTEELMDSVKKMTTDMVETMKDLI